MILALDVGNTNTVVGGFAGERLCFSFRMQSDRNKTADEYVLLLRGLLAEQGVDLSAVGGASSPAWCLGCATFWARAWSA